MPNFTPEDLIRYLYSETTSDESSQIESALKTDWVLNEKYAVLVTSLKRLDSLVQSPRIETVLSILRYTSKITESIAAV